MRDVSCDVSHDPVDRLKRRDLDQILVTEQHFLSLMIGPLD